MHWSWLAFAAGTATGLAAGIGVLLFGLLLFARGMSDTTAPHAETPSEEGDPGS
jgi:hypothetical protein